MNTHNIISTPNITGNIGSCTTQTVTVVERSGVWHETGHTTATNSCTGEITTTPYSTVSMGPTIIGMICATIVLYAIFRKADNVTKMPGYF